MMRTEYLHRLNEYNKSDLPDPIDRLIIIIALELVVEDSTGTYLLLNYHSYDLERSDDVQEGFWVPPFVAITRMSDPPISTVEGVRNWVARERKAIDLDEERKRVVSAWALPRVETWGETEEFTEIKRSPREPKYARAYHIIRCPVLGLESRGKFNVLDAECRKGHVFLPLHDLGRVITRHYSEAHKLTLRYFLSKPLATNVAYVLDNRQQSLLNTVRYRDDEFRLSEFGLLILVDLAGFSGASRHATETMRTFEMTGNDAADEYHRKIAEACSFFCTAVGTTAVRMTGDGFIAAVPERHFGLYGGLALVLERVFRAHGEFLSVVEALNDRMSATERRVGSRMSLHLDHYGFGRVRGAVSFSPEFLGASMIRLSRMERVQSKLMEGDPEVLAAFTGDPESLPALNHTVLCSPEVRVAAAEAFDAAGLHEIGALVRAPSKGEEIYGWVYAFGAQPWQRKE